MKRIVITTLVIGLFSFAGLQAQINENVKKETTLKKVTVKDTNVETIVDKEVDEKRSVIKVEGTDETNQNSEELIISGEKNYSVEVIDKELNVENQKDLDKLKKEENERIDGQQRGVPIQTDADTLQKPRVYSTSEKEKVKMIEAHQRGAPTQMGKAAVEKSKTTNTLKKDGGGN